MPHLLASLGSSHNNRFDLIDEPDDIDKAIEYTTIALTLTRKYDQGLLGLLGNLGVYHAKRFQRLGELGDLEKAIECGSRAVALTPDGHPDLSGRLANLAGHLTDINFSVWRLGELGDLEKAIECGSRALALTPDGHPHFSALLANLGVSHSYRFQRLGELGDLEKAIECGSRALALTPDGHPDLSGRLDNLGTSHSYRFQRLGELGDLEKAIECESRALALTPDGHPHFSTLLANLGVSHRYRFQRLGELGDLEKAIECGSRALALTPDGHPHLSGRLSNLGASHSYRFQRLGELGDLEKAIECGSRALALTPDGHPHFSALLANLGVSHSYRFQRLGELGDLEKAIECGSRAVALTPDGHPHLSGRLANLGASHSYRFQRLGELGDLEKAIECESRAVALTPDGHPDLSGRLDNLGASHRHRFQRLGELGDLEKAIECGSRALALTPDGHPDLSDRLDNLGASHRYRSQRLGELGDLEKAIECESRAVALTPDGHPDLSGRLANLLASHSYRFQRLGELGDLEKAIECGSRALALTPDGHPDFSALLANFGASHSYRFQRLGELGDLEKAIECGSRAVALTPDGHPNFSTLLANLGVSHCYRFQRLGDLEKAIECGSRALALTPDGHPHFSTLLGTLGVSHSYRFQRLGELGDLEKAIECESRALALTPDGHPQSPHIHFQLANNRCLQYIQTRDHSHLPHSLHSYRMASQSLVGSPRDKFRYAFSWAKRASRLAFLNPIEAYQTAIYLLPHFIWLGATTTQRYHDLSTAESLAVGAALSAILALDFSLALEWLEHARCVVWNQSLMLRSPLDQLRSSNPALADRLQDVSNQLHDAGSQSRESQALSSGSLTPEQVAQKHRQLAKDYEGLIVQVRTLPGFEDFLQPIKAKGLLRATQNGPVVVINCHQDRCDALVIIPGQENVQHIPLPNFTAETAQYTRLEMNRSVRESRLRERGAELWSDILRKLDFGDLLAILWYQVVKPVLDYLGYTDNVSSNSLPHITWCPTGPMSFLPLHAAGDYNQPQSRVFDYVVSSYTPTVTALLSSSPTSLSRDTSILAIAQPNTPGHTPLPGTTKELGYLKAHTSNIVEYSELIGNQATIKTVLDAMSQHDWVHLACHAHQNVQDSTKSGFFLHDGTLDLASINRRSFKNKGLAFLSACQTAKGDEKLPDEAIHLASGMLMAGYTSVIATMWSVMDDDAPFVANRVYDQLLKGGTIGKGEAGKALHYAVAALREEVGEKSFGRWVPYIHFGS
ncbi:hypothetical protein OPQ81_011274 [Rhizoctonia solani]|nr:hypothetical protein OPQ81_011274 [Rhizoctonia solani]